MGFLNVKRAPSNLSVAFLVSLSLLMMSFGVAPYLNVVRPPADTPILGTFRDPKTGRFFIEGRLKVAPVLYGLFHIVPALLWSIGIPIQHSASIRARWPALHRWSGRITFLSGLTLNVTGLVLIARKLSYSAPFWHVHQWGPLRFPSFSLSSAMVGLVWPPSLVKAYLTARSRQWAAHRRWATIYTITGCIISLERVALVASLFVGNTLTRFPTLRQSLGVPKIGTQGYEVEQAVFAFGNVAAAVAAAIWYYRVFHGAKEVKKVEKTV